MYLLFLAFWILLNGRFTVEILLFGLVIAAGVFWFICKFMDYSIRKEILLFRSAGILFVFLGVLIREIFKANWGVLMLILSPKYQPEPELVVFKTDLKSGICKVLLANAITLTPGTITVSLVDDEYCVHAMDKSMAEGIENCEFVRILKKMEEGFKK